MTSILSLLLVLVVFLGVLHTPALASKDQEYGLSLLHRDGSNDDSTKYACSSLLERREWRTLDDAAKADYIKAVKCFQALPAKKPVISAAKSRFDEFQAFHISIAEHVHLAGQFLPWHRHFLRRYEIALQTECHYQGAAPYWDWSQDADEAASIAGAPVFDPITGFGGDGVPGTYTLPNNLSSVPQLIPIVPVEFRGCVMDGPFANHTVRLGPGKLVTTHCLTRGINQTMRMYLSSSAVARTTKLPTFEQFRIELEGQPITNGPRMHDGGHFAVGGDMSNFYSSPADPLFYLHHANLDRIWWNWQQMLPSRLYEISGRSTIFPPYTNVTLDFELQMGSLGPTIPIREVMDIHRGPGCYTYV